EAGAVRGGPGARWLLEPERPGRRADADVQHVGAVEHADIAGLPSDRGEGVEVLAGDLGDVQARHVRVGEGQHLWPSRYAGRSSTLVMNSASDRALSSRTSVL